MIDDRWNISPARIYMSPEDFRDLLISGLISEGMSEEEASLEADRRLAIIMSEEDPDPMIMEFAQRMPPAED